jgi:hypothetical protein
VGCWSYSVAVGLELVPSRGWFLRKSKDFFTSAIKVLKDATVKASE